VVAKLDRLARSLRDTKDIVDELFVKDVKLGIGGFVHDPTESTADSGTSKAAQLRVRQPGVKASSVGRGSGPDAQEEVRICNREGSESEDDHLARFGPSQPSAVRSRVTLMVPIQMTVVM
jgi:hypothetical protein